MLKSILLVGAGGALGSIARYLISNLMVYFAICGEVATLAVNVIGSFLIGLLIPLLGSSGQLILAVGFCGGFTTFSTVSYQALHLFQTGQRLSALIYIVSSVVLSILSALIGIYLSEKFI